MRTGAHLTFLVQTRNACLATKLTLEIVVKRLQNLIPAYALFPLTEQYLKVLW